MAELTTKQRKKIPSSKFALEKERKYPIQDKAHAVNAKARAQQQFDKGKLSKAALDKIDREANKVIKESAPKKKKATASKSKPSMKSSASAKKKK